MVKHSKEDKKNVWSEYLKLAQYYKFLPKDQYSHATFLITQEPKTPEQLSDLLDKHILLANIHSDRYLKFLQNDAYFLTEMFDMKRRAEFMKYVFDPLFTAWKLELNLTRTKDGLERKLQHFGPQDQKKLKTSGFGLPKKKEEEVETYVIYQ